MTIALLLLLHAPAALEAATPASGLREAPSAGGSATLIADGVLVDSTTGTAYLMRPEGGIEAMDLASGNALWTSTEAAKPLALAGNLLVAQAEPGEAGGLSLASLDVSRSGALQARAAVELPDGLVGLVDDTLALHFDTRASLSGGAVTIGWEAVLPPQRAYLPGDAEGATPSQLTARRTAGALQLDPATGSVTPVAAAREGLAAPTVTTELAREGATADGRRFLSADGRHVLVSRPVADGDLDRLYRWTLVERTSGAVLGTVESPYSMAPFVVVGDTLVHVLPSHGRFDGEQTLQKPPSLRAVSLSSGTQEWTRELRDTVYRGPFPV